MQAINKLTMVSVVVSDMKTAKEFYMGFYLSSSDIAAAHKALNEKGVKPSEVRNDLNGPGSDVKFFQLKDPDGNPVTVAQE